MLMNVQFLRFAAAMLVVVYHVSSHVRDAGADPGAFFLVAEAIGFAGVDIFFVISGFIMSWTTAELGGTGHGWLFARRRIARIYSGYWPFFGLAILLFWWMNPAQLARANLLGSATLVPTGGLLIAVSWTLVFEMFFYLVFSVLIATGLHRARRVLPLLLVAIVVFAAYSQFVRHAYDPGQLETMSVAEYYMLSPYLAEFLAGSVLANWLLHRPRGPAVSLLAAGIAIFLAGGWINVAAFQGHIEQGYFVFYRVAVFGTASVLIVAGLVRLEGAGRHAARTFSLLAGGASYAIYLSHTLFLGATQHLGLNRWLSGHGPALVQIVFLLYAGLVLLHGVAHYQWFERPLHRQFRRWLRV